MAHGLLNFLWGRHRTWPLHVVYLVWGYALSSQTMLVVTQAQHASTASGRGYQYLGLALMTLYLVSDGIINIWLAERKQDRELKGIVYRHHFLAAAIWLYTLLAMRFWPEQGHLAFIRTWIHWMQQLLAVPGLGICLGVIGILYQLGLVRRIVRFIRIGPKGLPPFQRRGHRDREGGK
ncbi:hypothetical protein JW933_04100 [candidate division FCPU426 bacterium]|nr:hypothetical protein [candidate division FCPU426 bacterium]